MNYTYIVYFKNDPSLCNIRRQNRDSCANFPPTAVTHISVSPIGQSLPILSSYWPTAQELCGCGNYKCLDSSHRVNVTASLHVNISTHKQTTPWPCVY